MERSVRAKTPLFLSHFSEDFNHGDLTKYVGRKAFIGL
jgi:hypothetical protein